MFAGLISAILYFSCGSFKRVAGQSRFFDPPRRNEGFPKKMRVSMGVRVGVCVTEVANRGQLESMRGTWNKAPNAI